MACRIHPSSIISPEAELADDVEIGPFCRIVGKVKIGQGTTLESNVLIDTNTSIGSGNRISHGVVLGTPPQDKKFDLSTESYLEIGDENMFREYATANRATGNGNRTIIGSRCMFMANTHIAHNCLVGDEVIMANVATLAGHVEVQDWCVIGGVMAVHQYARIGKGAFVGGISGLRQDLPPFFRASGLPALPVGLNIVGMQRRGFALDKIRIFRSIYRILYRSKLTMDEAIAKIQGQYGEHDEVKMFLAFLSNSRNGIARPKTGRTGSYADGDSSAGE